VLLELVLLVELLVNPATVNDPPVGGVLSLVKVRLVVTVLPAASEPTTAIVGDEVVLSDHVRAFDEKVRVDPDPNPLLSVLLVNTHPVVVPPRAGKVTLNGPDSASVTEAVSVSDRLELAAPL
jgi:hypothetical protein